MNVNIAELNYEFTQFVNRCSIVDVQSWK